MNQRTVMSESSNLVLALLEGVMLGAVFFGGLWLTIRRAVSSKRPAAWFFASLLLRTTVVVSGLYLASRGDWRRLVACLIGFFVARVGATWLARAPAEKSNRTLEGGGP
jgi:F1F0 ATPase subunit 2